MKKFFVRLLIAINIIIIMGMLFTGYADVMDPRKYDILALAGYAFPVVCIANIFMIMVWVCVRKRLLAIPFAGFLLCFSPAMEYCPISLTSEPDDYSMKIMTFNTWELATQDKDFTQEEMHAQRKTMLQKILEADCDIVCLQETYFNNDVCTIIDSIVKPKYAYTDSCMGRGNSQIQIFSKYPVKRHELIDYETIGNISAAFYLDYNGSELIIVNNHLQTNSFSTAEKEQIGVLVHGKMEKGKLEHESRYVVRKLANAAKIRAAQADSVAAFIANHKGKDMIVCGDFNDIPISYAHRIIQGQLTDCYKSSATGPGFSYKKHGMYVRIDNIMCSERFTPVYTKVDKSIELSDHFPIITYMK